MKIAVITPYHRESPEILRACHQSVLAQSTPCEHFMVADGFPNPDVASWKLQHIILPKAHADLGNTPRAVGSLSAMNQGFDAICFLDADNFYYPGHIEAMVNLHQKTGAAVCIATRTINALDGSVLLPAGRAGDGTDHVDTSCLFFTAAAFRLLPTWAMMPPQLGVCADQVMWIIIRQLNFPRAVHPTPTVAFRTQYAVDYQTAGQSPPPNAKTAESTYLPAMKWWRELPEAVRHEYEQRMGLRTRA
jgi:glycosyltransferase involved in cell wall biosynthesis